MKCAFCHKTVAGSKVYIRDQCPACGNDLHICINCEFYDANAYRQCRESISEPVPDKERANYCDFFRSAKNGVAADASENDAIKKLHDLFK